MDALKGVPHSADDPALSVTALLTEPRRPASIGSLPLSDARRAALGSPEDADTGRPLRSDERRPVRGDAPDGV